MAASKGSDGGAPEPVKIDKRLHPRLRTMLNMHLGPLTLLSETQATLRIPFPDEGGPSCDLDAVYPKARTFRDPRSLLAGEVTPATTKDLQKIERAHKKAKAKAASEKRAEKRGQKRGQKKVHKIAAEGSGANGDGMGTDEVKGLTDSPGIEEKLPRAEFSVFVRVAGGSDQLAAVRKIVEDLGKQRGRVDVHDVSMASREDMYAMSLGAVDLLELAKTRGIASIESGDQVRKLPLGQGAGPVEGAPLKSLRKVEKNEGRHDYGTDTIIGIVDVEGFDFAHRDFVDEDAGETTRFLSIWDQGATADGGYRPPPGQTRASERRMGYGAEITRDHMNAALVGAAQFGLRATDLEPQTSMIPGSHGTHVASIAAGNRGVARKADIVGVTIALADGDLDRRRSFYDTSRLAHAIDYIFEQAEYLAAQEESPREDPIPVSINVSLGTNGHSHDGTAVINRWIDHAVATHGRAVTVAAGNAGATEPDPEGGISHLLGRVHASGKIEARELSQELHWNVMGEGFADMSVNEMEIWYPAQDRISVKLTAPDGEAFPMISSGYQLVNAKRENDLTRVSIYNDRYHPINGFNRISIYLEPYFGTDNAGTTAVVGVPGGTWTVQLVGDEIRDGTWHAWIERDDPHVIGDFDDVTVARLPSYFADGTYSPTMQISTLACGTFVNAVANLDESQRAVNPSSSRGPTRTGDPKPDLAAPGTDIVAAYGFGDSADEWIALTGTSMAAPYVTGVVGLMLAIDPGLTATQITSILRRTAKPLPDRTFAWQDDAGYGEIDANAAIGETVGFMPTEDYAGAEDRFDKAVLA